MIIYCVTNKINNKKYIGQTSQKLRKRKLHHIRSAELDRYNTYFHRALKKYGEDSFTWEILYECINREELNEKEIYFINKLDTYEKGYNMSLGGLGHNNIGGKSHPMFGKHHSEETKQKLREYNLGKKLSEETKIKIGKASKGRLHTEKSKKRISEANKGRKRSNKAIEHAREFKSFYWLIEYCGGRKEIIKNLRQFCRDNKQIDRRSLVRASKIGKFYKGFRCKRLYDLNIIFKKEK